MKNIKKLIKFTIKFSEIYKNNIKMLDIFLGVKESFGIKRISSMKIKLEILSNLLKKLKNKGNNSVLFMTNSPDFDDLVKSIAFKYKSFYILSGQYKRGLFSNKLPAVKITNQYKPLNLPLVILYVGFSFNDCMPLISELKKTDIIIVGINIPKGSDSQSDYKFDCYDKKSLKFLIKFLFTAIYETVQHKAQ